MSQTQNMQELFAQFTAFMQAQNGTQEPEATQPAQDTQQNLSQRYKAYKGRQKAEGRSALDFKLWKERYGTRAPRGSKQPSQAIQVVAQERKVTKQAQPSQGHVTIQNPDDQATGRQLWKLMDLGLIPFVSKGEASQLIEAALATA